MGDGHQSCIQAGTDPLRMERSRKAIFHLCTCRYCVLGDRFQVLVSVASFVYRHCACNNSLYHGSRSCHPLVAQALSTTSTDTRDEIGGNTTMNEEKVIKRSRDFSRPYRITNGDKFRLKDIDPG